MSFELKIFGTLEFSDHLLFTAETKDYLPPHWKIHWRSSTLMVTSRYLNLSLERQENTALIKGTGHRQNRGDWQQDLITWLNHLKNNGYHIEIYEEDGRLINRILG